MSKRNPAEEGNALDSPVGDRGSRLLLAGGSGTDLFFKVSADVLMDKSSGETSILI